MITQGSDGLSRGDNSTGAMAGKDFLEYIPLNLNAFERQANIKRVVEKDWLGKDWKATEPEDWFYKVFQEPEGKWIWAPPPVVAKVALEQLCEVKLMYPRSSHVFVCPALMTGEWRKQLGKLGDSMFTFAAGSTIWPLDMFEPLTVCFIAPLLHSKPFKASRLSRVAKWESRLSEM